MPTFKVSSMQSYRFRLYLILLCAVFSGPVLAYPAPEADPDLPASTVPPAVQQLRRDMLDPGINVLTFRSMDRIFTTRTVARSGPVWELPRADHELNLTYQYHKVKLIPRTSFWSVPTPMRCW